MSGGTKRTTLGPAGTTNTPAANSALATSAAIAGQLSAISTPVRRKNASVQDEGLDEVMSSVDEVGLSKRGRTYDNPPATHI